MLAMPSNLLAHHLNVLEQAGLVTRRRSEGDRRRTYLRLVPGALDPLAAPPAARAASAVRLHRELGPLPPGRRAVAPRQHDPGDLGRHPPRAARSTPARSPPPGATGCRCPGCGPGTSTTSRSDDDLVVTVCDRAHEELGRPAAVHWSVPDPVPAGDPASFDAAVADLSRRVGRLAPRLAATS